MNWAGLELSDSPRVTEAGEGEDGRIKSAIGIGSLLCDGLGDTIRVSLTEDSPHEIEVCRDLLAQIPIAYVESQQRRSPDDQAFLRSFHFRAPRHAGNRTWPTA